VDIGTLIDNLSAVSIPKIVEEATYNTSDRLVKSQRAQMLYGEGSKGKIGKYRSAAYARKKYQMNPIAGEGNVDLRLTGDFSKGVFADVRTDGVVLDSGDPKTSALVKKYGEDIFGLNPDYAADYSEKVLQPEGVRLFESKVFK
jgi:hypothetical protein